jgi:Ni,Fe-hydrogenase III small subunit/ferredoxin
MAWILRGLRDGIVTTRYPRRPDGYGPGYRGVISVTPTPVNDDGGPAGRGGRPFAEQCPTGAVAATVDKHLAPSVRVDRGRCILCGRCVEADPETFSFSPAVESAALDRSVLVVPNLPEDDATLSRLRRDLHHRARALRRSIFVRHVDAGSDGAEEWEVAALTNPVYDVQRLGLFFTATPRHADVLLVTGVGTVGMAGPLRRTYDAMPGPKVVVAAGTDAASGGLVHPSYAVGPGIGSLVPVDVWVPGSPPSPFSLLHGLLLGVGLLHEEVSAP